MAETGRLAEPLSLLIEVPVCAFRPYTSREYQDTYPVPPPSSVYGMLLSLVGVSREERESHRGVEMALAVERLPERSRVFRKLRRGKTLGESRPDYQDILTDLRLWVWLRAGSDAGNPTLVQRVRSAFVHPEKIKRSGGLSLGESSYLVNSISLGKDAPPSLAFINPDGEGFHALPVWVDHTDLAQTRQQRFSLKFLPVQEGLATAWLKIS